MMILSFVYTHSCTLHIYGHGGGCAVQCPSRNEANKSLATLAVSSFDIPGDTRFPLNAFMTKPSNRGESGKWIYLCMLNREQSVQYSSCHVFMQFHFWLDCKFFCDVHFSIKLYMNVSVSLPLSLPPLLLSQNTLTRSNASVLHPDAPGDGPEDCWEGVWPRRQAQQGRVKHTHYSEWLWNRNVSR